MEKDNSDLILFGDDRMLWRRHDVELMERIEQPAGAEKHPVSPHFTLH